MYLKKSRAFTCAVGIALPLVIILAGCSGDEDSFPAVELTAPANTAAAAIVSPPAASVISTPAGSTAGGRSVSINWTAPTEYEDGSPFIDLAGYRIWYGNTPGSYSTLVEIAPGTTSHRVHSLAATTYYFSITAYNHEGAESTLSNEVMVRLN